MNIKRENGKFIIEIHDKTPRCNPYDDTEDTYMDSVVGLITHHPGYSEFGLAWRIDMAYKDKEDQTGSYVTMWDGSDEEEFMRLCKELKIDVETYNLTSE